MLAESFTLAAAQVEPVFQDKEATLNKACQWIEEAGNANVDLIVFPETFLPGYPYWGEWVDAARWSERMVELQKNSLHVEDDAVEIIGDEAADADVNVVLGANELSNRPGSDTVYNSLFYFDRSGSLLGRHRKLMPTHFERTVWGRGDPGSLATYDLDVGTLGGLICYENHMTLSKAAICAKGEEIHAATWPGFWSPTESPSDSDGTTSKEIIETCEIYPAVRQYAFETQSFVVSASTYLSDQTLADFPNDAIDYRWISGGSMLIGPTGTVKAGPVFDEETLLTAEFSRDERRTAKAYFDGMGHYTRWDAVSIEVSDATYEPVHSPDTSTGPGGGPAGERSTQSQVDSDVAEMAVERMAERYDISVEAVQDIIENVRG